MTALLTVVAVLVLFAGSAAAAPGDPRVVKGTLEWPATLTTEPIAVVRADDGGLVYVDTSTADRLGAPITGRVSIVGVEGTKPQELSAVIVGAGDSAVQARASGPAEAVDDLWRVQGKVRGVTVSDIIVETPQGQIVRVDASRLSPWTRQTVRPGDEVKLYGEPQADQRLVANGFIHLMPLEPAASPSWR